MARRDAIRKLTRAILAPVPKFSLIEARKRGIKRSQLISVRDALTMAESRFSQSLKELQAACDEAANECEGKSEDEIRAILRRIFGAVLPKDFNRPSARKAASRVDTKNTAAKKVNSYED